MANKGKNVPVKKGKAKTGQVQRYEPLSSLRAEIDNLFDDFAMGWPLRSSMQSARRMLDPWRAFAGLPGEGMPAVDVVDSDKAMVLKAELPGIDEKDVDVSIANGMLTIRGEKKEEREEGEKEGRYYMSERKYGSFERSFRLPEGIDLDKVDARFDKGVLNVTLPKTAEAQQKVKKIEVKGG